MKKLYSSINNLNHAFWARIVRATSVDIKSLCVFRMIIGVGLLLFQFSTFSWIGKVPRALFKPHILGLPNLVGTFPPSSFFITIDLLLLLTIVCIIVGIKARLATIIYVALSIIGLSFKYSFGKIDHGILEDALLACLSFSGWGSRLAVLPDKPTSVANTEKSLSLAALLICFAFFTAGFQKALNWLDFNPNTSGFAYWYYNGAYNLDRKFLLAPLFHYIPFRFLEVFDYSAILFELSPLLFLLHSRKAWRIWLLIASIFHLINALVLNISFIAHSIIYLAFIDYPSLFSRIKSLSEKRAYRIAFFAVIAILVLLRLRIVFTYNQSHNILVADYLIEANLYVAMLIWITTILIIARSILKIRFFAKPYTPQQ